MYHNHKSGYHKIATFLVSAALGWYFAFAIGFAQAQAPGCPCTFKEAPWEAYGTKAACTTITRKGGTSCEIEFGGVSADPKIAAQVLGLDPSAYTKDAYEILGQFLRYLRDNKREALAEPKFLSIALPIFMRGAYLRRSLGDESCHRRGHGDSVVTKREELSAMQLGAWVQVPTVGMGLDARPHARKIFHRSGDAV